MDTNVKGVFFLTQRLLPLLEAAATADDPYWSSPEYKEAVGSILNQLTVWRHENPYRFLDVSSKYINIRNGIRTSWSPPACSCRRIKVWIYGGSTTWGIDQRDDHTIPSELARAAFENGLTVDVEAPVHTIDGLVDALVEFSAT